MVPPTRPLAARRWWRRLHSLALSLKDGGGAISFPGRALSPQGVAGTGSSPLWPDDLLPTHSTPPQASADTIWKQRKKGVQARMLDYSVLMFKHHRPGSLQWPTRCHGHMCGGDGSIQAHIKACAALRAISVVTAHNTISSGMLPNFLLFSLLSSADWLND
ncbi:hypothetical protein DAI22_12g121000 [Oryza sativa Japonica Group]|nr:hypothetical protein DAI22_12g121000 [Oryza sativa Japonica Group]